MIKKICLLLFAMMIAVSAMAQLSAKDITKIKKSNSYIYAESTEATENDAYNSAKQELDMLVEEYVVSSGIGKEAVAVIVKDIKQVTSQIAIMRGDMHRVFLYVKKSDISTSKSDVTVMEVPSTENNPQVDSSTKSSNSSYRDSMKKVEYVKREEKKEQNYSATGFFAQITDNRAAVLARIAGANSMSEVEKILFDEKNFRNVKGYGSSIDCPNAKQSYWVVKTSNGITILSPDRNGTRWNYKTGNTDSLENYENRLWFRL